MKTLLLSSILVTAVISAPGASTVNTANRYAYGANIGWMDFRADGNNGAVIGEYVCSGFIYSANVGWINLGNGAPANGIRYQNNSAGLGVNQDGLGNLRGYAYSANIGWINFENNGAPKVDLVTGKLSGSVYSANCGWISLSNSTAQVQTDIIAPATDSDHNGLADAWEMEHFGHIGVDANADPDGDGASNLQEYLADTDPRDSGSSLRILNLKTSFWPNGTDSDFLTWTSRPTRNYILEERTGLSDSTPWTELFLFAPDSGSTTERSVGFGVPSQQRFFRVRAVKPLAPQ